MRTTKRARTLIDAAAVMSPDLIARHAQEWLADRRLSVEQLDAAIARAGRHPGADHLRASLAEVDLVADPAAEARLGRVLLDGGIRVEHHVLVTTATGHTFELDWALAAERIGLELDGYGVHLRSVAVFDSDRVRRNELEIAGWTILNFTTRQLRRPDLVVDQVRRAITASISRSR